jgi:hypothetical protein
MLSATSVFLMGEAGVRFPSELSSLPQGVSTTGVLFPDDGILKPDGRFERTISRMSSRCGEKYHKTMKVKFCSAMPLELGEAGMDEVTK